MLVNIYTSMKEKHSRLNLINVSSYVPHFPQTLI